MDKQATAHSTVQRLRKGKVRRWSLPVLATVKLSGGMLLTMVPPAPHQKYRFSGDENSAHATRAWRHIKFTYHESDEPCFCA